MDRAAKGGRAEKRCADELRAAGYPHIWKSIRVRFQNIDLFGLFDICALKADGSEMLLIQVKSNRRCDKPTREAIRALGVPEGVSKQVWVWYDRKGWKKEEL